MALEKIERNAKTNLEWRTIIDAAITQVDSNQLAIAAAVAQQQQTAAIQDDVDANSLLIANLPSQIITDDDALGGGDKAPTHDNVKNYIAANPAASVGGITGIYESELFDIPQGNVAKEISHGLGKRPLLFFLIAECISAINGWNVGDEVIWASDDRDGGHDGTIWATDTTVGYKADKSYIRIMNRDSDEEKSYYGNDGYFKLKFRAIY